MVLGLAKWAYNLGVKQERNRVASELRTRAMSYHNEFDTYMAALNGKSHSKSDQKTMETRANIAKEVENVIQSLFHGEVHETSSFLFPNDNIEKELN